MAEFGAHLATASSELPSIFEVLAQENLSSTLGPAFSHLVKALTQIDTVRFQRLWKWHQELFTTLEFILQHYCLKSCGASFAEQFYGLKRSPLGVENQLRVEPTYTLPTAHHRRALACLVLIPYIRLKMDNLYEKLTEEETDSTESNTEYKNKWLILKLVFMKIYPLVHLSWELIVLIYQVSYALGKTTFSSPLYQLARTRLITLTDDDSTEQPLLQLWNDVRTCGLMSIPSTVFFHLTSNTRQLFTSTLSIGTFFLQYLEWWYSNKNSLQEQLVSVVPFPLKDSAQVQVPKGTLCPICLKNRTNDTALSASGYVFCYPCIYHFVSENGVCPVTRLPSDVNQLVRLFTNT